MGWNFEDFQRYEEKTRQTGRVSALLIGVGIGMITLLVITAMIFTTVSLLADPVLEDSQPQTQRQTRDVTRHEPSADDLRNANYRPSEWQPMAQQQPTPTPLPVELVQQADAEYLLLENIYERVSPSVVNIEIVSRYHSESDTIDSSGSGFVLDMEGHIVTNSHVVRDAEEILVTFSNGYATNAEVVGIDDYSDLAVVQIDPTGAPLVPVVLGDSGQLRVGQRVIAIGNPFGLEGSMTVGIVSALGRTLPSVQLLDPTSQPYSNPSIIQVDASVNPGNSGGPLLDSYGQVIGINTAIRTESGGFEGIAFAVPVNTVKRVIPQLIDSGEAKYSWLGISTPPSVPGLSLAAIADELALPVTSGVMIDTVLPDSPAERAGLRGGTQSAQVRGIDVPIDGDIVVAINSIMINDIDDLIAYLVENTSPGQVVVLTIVREGQTLDVNVELGVRPD